MTTCRAELKKFEEAWAAVRAFDKRQGATASRASGWAQAFSAKKEADMGEIAQMRGLLTAMGGLSAQADAGCRT